LPGVKQLGRAATGEVCWGCAVFGSIAIFGVIVLLRLEPGPDDSSGALLLRLAAETGSQSSSLGVSTIPLARETGPPKQSSSFAEIVGDGSLSCPELKRRVQDKEFAGPNQGEMYARVIGTPPQDFNISLHTAQFDPLRWNTIYKTGKYYEHEVHRRFLHVLADREKGSIVMDVGSNIGYYTLLSLVLGRRVISFEVNPVNILRLCESLQLNHWGSDRSAIFQRGVYNVDGEIVPIRIPLDNPGTAVIKVGMGDAKLHATTVTLDAFAEGRGWFERPGFSVVILKVDVEGKEPMIIEGAKRLLKSGIVENIFVEVRRMGRGIAQQAVETLLSSSYVLVDKTKKGGRKTIEESREYLAGLKSSLGQKSVDLWFQRGENSAGDAL
jgi:FkbM family methyltransferase